MRSTFVFFLLFFLFLVRFLANKPVYHDGEVIRISGTVTSEPILYTNRQGLKLSNLKIYLPSFPEIHYGDKIVVEGVVNDGGLEHPKLIRHDQGNNMFLSFKRKLVTFWQKTLPEPHSSLVAGIVLGSKASIPQGFWNELKKTGTTHVVVASGMNVTFVASFLISSLTLFLKRKWAVLVSILGIWVYSFMAGLEAPIVRAAIMASVVLVAQALGRLTETLRIFFLTALVMLVVNPYWIGDMGFLLSCGSTLSLILFGTKVNTKLSFVPAIFREGLSTSIAAQIGVAPILYFAFGQFNIFSPIVNMLVLWIIPLVMVIGSIGGLLGLVIPILGELVTYLLYPLTSWFIWTVNFFANI